MRKKVDDPRLMIKVCDLYYNQNASRQEIGQELGEIYQVSHLPSDFKKKDGYKRSIQLSREYGLYRQNYCGCVFSRRDRKEELSKPDKL